MNQHENQIRATRALIKFSEDHGYDVKGVDNIRACLNALERNDVTQALECYRKVPLGGMGCFTN